MKSKACKLFKSFFILFLLIGVVQMYGHTPELPGWHSQVIATANGLFVQIGQDSEQSAVPAVDQSSKTIDPDLNKPASQSSVSFGTTDKLVTLRLVASAGEYNLETHPDKSAKTAYFDIDRPGILRITYVDAIHNSDAEGGGLSWRNVPGATNYAKMPGKEKAYSIDPDPAVNGQRYTEIHDRKIEKPMTNVGVVLTPRHRKTWTYGGYQYASDLLVTVEWRPDQTDPSNTGKSKDDSSDLFVGNWNLSINGKVVDIIRIQKSGNVYTASFYEDSEAMPYSTVNGHLNGDVLVLETTVGQGRPLISIEIKLIGDRLEFTSFDPDGSTRFTGIYIRNLGSKKSKKTKTSNSLNGKWLDPGTNGFWIFTPLPGGGYKATYEGDIEAQGQARLQGQNMEIQFRVEEIYILYQLTLSSDGNEARGEWHSSDGESEEVILTRIKSGSSTSGTDGALRPGEEPQILFENANSGGVQNAPQAPTMITLSSPQLITRITTYHYNHNQGDSPGTLSLTDDQGHTYGPWRTLAQNPNGTSVNKYWTVAPMVVIPAGKYQLLDSNPATWSHNATSGNRGIAWVEGVPR